jgi:hypothetical protein
MQPFAFKFTTCKFAFGKDYYSIEDVDNKEQDYRLAGCDAV